MIKYKRGGKWHIINLFFCAGSLFPKSFVVAFPSAVVTFLIKYFAEDLAGEHSLLLNTTTWQGFTTLVGFLVVFRTSQAYSRFWDGCSYTHRMRAEWIDAASAVVAFTKHSSADPKKILEFKHVIVRLFSILHTMAIGEIEECEDFAEVMAFDLELIDPNGIDYDSWKALQNCQNKVALVFQWIQCAIVENITTGVLSIPPPILSRVFQELANGMVALHEAHKIASIPFPFPYAQTCDALLVMHWILTPLITAGWSSNYYTAPVFSFIQVFILWSLNNIAVEIEHPFGDDANDLDASQMQLDMNMSLLLLLHPASERTPKLSKDARISDLVIMGRAASQGMERTHTFNAVMKVTEQKIAQRQSMLQVARDLVLGDDQKSSKRSQPSTREAHRAFWASASVPTGATVETTDSSSTVAVVRKASTSTLGQVEEQRPSRAASQVTKLDAIPDSEQSQASSSPAHTPRLEQKPVIKGPTCSPQALRHWWGDLGPEPTDPAAEMPPGVQVGAGLQSSAASSASSGGGSPAGPQGRKFVEGREASLDEPCDLEEGRAPDRPTPASPPLRIAESGDGGLPPGGHPESRDPGGGTMQQGRAGKGASFRNPLGTSRKNQSNPSAFADSQIPV